MALKDSNGAALTKLRLSIVFEGVAGMTETDYLVFNPSTNVGTALAIVRSHFMQKFYSSSLPQKVRTPRGESSSKPGGKEYLCDCVALWTYDAEESDELSFKDGDIIGVVAKPHKVLRFFVSKLLSLSASATLSLVLSCSHPLEMVFQFSLNYSLIHALGLVDGRTQRAKRNISVRVRERVGAGGRGRPQRDHHGCGVLRSLLPPPCRRVASAHTHTQTLRTRRLSNIALCQTPRQSRGESSLSRPIDAYEG